MEAATKGSGRPSHRDRHLNSRFRGEVERFVVSPETDGPVPNFGSRIFPGLSSRAQSGKQSRA